MSYYVSALKDNDGNTVYPITPSGAVYHQKDGAQEKVSTVLDRHNTQLGGLYFGTDASGKMGYTATEGGEITPFRNPTGDAVEAEVLSGKVFSSAALEDATGSMPNHGAWTSDTVDAGNVAIPLGYHNGQGYISGAGAYNAGYAAGDAANVKVYYLGYGTQFSAASIPGYRNMTADNFVIRPDFTSFTDSNTNAFTVGKAGGGTSTGRVNSSVGVTLTKTYDASTGVLNCSLTITYNTSRSGGDSDSWWDSNGNKNVSNTYSVSAYCIVDLSKVKSI